MTQDEIYNKALVCMDSDANQTEDELYGRLILAKELYKRKDCNNEIYELYQHLTNLRGVSIMNVDTLRDEIVEYNNNLIEEIAFLQAVETSDVENIPEDLLDLKIEDTEQAVLDELSYNGCEAPDIYEILCFCEENNITMKVDKDSVAYDDMWSTLPFLQYVEPKPILFGHPQTLLFGLEDEERDEPMILDYGNVRLAYL